MLGIMLGSMLGIKIGNLFGIMLGNIMMLGNMLGNLVVWLVVLPGTSSVIKNYTILWGGFGKNG